MGGLEEGMEPTAAALGSPLGMRGGGSGGHIECLFLARVLVFFQFLSTWKTGQGSRVTAPVLYQCDS